MASQFLAERAGHAPGGAGAMAASANRRLADEPGGLARARPAGLLHGDAHLRATRVGHRPFRWIAARGRPYRRRIPTKRPLRFAGRSRGRESMGMAPI